MKTQNWSLSVAFGQFWSALSKNNDPVSGSPRWRSFRSHSRQTRVNNWSENYCSDLKSCKRTAALPSRLPAGFSQTISQIQNADFGKDQHPLPETSVTVQMSPALRQDGAPSPAWLHAERYFRGTPGAKHRTLTHFCELPYILKSGDNIKTSHRLTFSCANPHCVANQCETE